MIFQCNVRDKIGDGGACDTCPTCLSSPELMGRLRHSCSGQVVSKILRASLTKDVVLKPREVAELQSSMQCAFCGYNPEVLCDCPHCNNSCKAKFFNPLDAAQREKAQRHLRGRQDELRKAQEVADRARQFAVSPTSGLGRSLSLADRRFVDALPSEVLAGIVGRYF